MTALDPVTLELVWTRLISAVDEAAKAIVRTSFSTLSNEANDFACVLTDAEGRSLAQNTGSIPSFIGTLPATVRAIRAAIPPERMRPVDVYVTNNPWIGTGHLNESPWCGRSSTAAASSATAPPRATCQTSAGASGAPRRVNSSRRASTSRPCC